MNFYLSSLLCFSIFNIFILNESPAQDRADRTFKGNNEGIFQILGTELKYEFISQNVSARVDINKNRIEFIFPLDSFEPIGDAEHIQILKDIFPSSLPLPLYLTATLDRETIGIENFSQPEHFILEGVLSLYEEHFRVAVEISIYSVDEKVFYNMVTQFDLNLLNRNYEGIYKEIITGEFVLMVNDAIWDQDFRE